MEEIMHFFDGFNKDMLQPIGYLPEGMLAGGVFLLLIWLGKRVFSRKGRRDSAQKDVRGAVLWFCTVTYLYVALKMAFFCREPGSRTKMDFQLFGTVTTIASARFLLENILLFVPFGVLFPCLFPVLRKGRVCVLAGCLCSIGIEITQGITGMGFCQLDDIVMNTLGAWAGWGIFRAVLHCRKGNFCRH